MPFCGTFGEASEEANHLHTAVRRHLQSALRHLSGLQPVRRAALVVPRLRICPPTQETRVPALDWEDATGQLSLCATATEPTLRCPRAATTERAPLESPRAPQETPPLTRPTHHHKRGAPSHWHQRKPAIKTQHRQKTMFKKHLKKKKSVKKGTSVKPAMHDCPGILSFPSKGRKLD